MIDTNDSKYILVRNLYNVLFLELILFLKKLKSIQSYLTTIFTLFQNGRPYLLLNSKGLGFYMCVILRKMLNLGLRNFETSEPFF